MAEDMARELNESPQKSYELIARKQKRNGATIIKKLDSHQIASEYLFAWHVI